MTVSNIPRVNTPISVAARKSFRLNLLLRRHEHLAVDLTDARISLTVAPARTLTRTVNDLVLSQDADIDAPTIGYAAFNIQAASLAIPPDEYDYDITLHKNGFSSLLLRGSFNVVENTDFSGLSGSFTDSNQSATLMLELSANHIHVDIGSGFPSGLLPDYVQVFHDALTEADELLNGGGM